MSLHDKPSALSTDKEPQPTGEAAHVLEQFRARMKELKAQGRVARRDMIAHGEFIRQSRALYNGKQRRHGELPDIPIGSNYKWRGECAVLGIHCLTNGGIDARLEQACFAVCLSGGYADDCCDDPSASDSSDNRTIVYTGAGGRDSQTGRQTKDQEENHWNRSLVLSYEQQTEIRVIRGKCGHYVYEGLYRCHGWKYEVSEDGPLIFKFYLKPVPGKVAHHVGEVHWGWHKKRPVGESRARRARRAKTMKLKQPDATKTSAAATALELPQQNDTMVEEGHNNKRGHYNLSQNPQFRPERVESRQAAAEVSNTPRVHQTVSPVSHVRPERVESRPAAAVSITPNEHHNLSPRSHFRPERVESRSTAAAAALSITPTEQHNLSPRSQVTPERVESRPTAAAVVSMTPNDDGNTTSKRRHSTTKVRKPPPHLDAYLKD